MRTYGIQDILDKQPKRLKNKQEFRDLLVYLKEHPKLFSITMPYRCFKLLSEGILEVKNLPNLYRTYKLPKDPFFNRFLKLKREQLYHRRDLKELRRQYILKKIKELPDEIVECFKFLGNLEKQLNRAGKIPVWQSVLLPKTKKAANEFEKKSAGEWDEYFSAFLNALEKRYGNLNVDYKKELLSRSIFGLLDGQLSEKEIRQRFKKLSLTSHPDQGGTHEHFLRIQEAMEQLLSRVN
jgi:hypothetical protein